MTITNPSSGTAAAAAAAADVDAVAGATAPRQVLPQPPLLLLMPLLLITLEGYLAYFKCRPTTMDMTMDSYSYDNGYGYGYDNGYSYRDDNG